ncbi:MAG: hypothetical protein RJA13_2074 [Bacteroidota bacterium]
MKHLKVGDKAPEFSGTDQNGATISLNDFKGKKLAIYFYPKDKACNIRDNYALLQKNGIHIVGVSADSISSHQKFQDKFALPFPLIADENKSVIEAFGVWGNKKFMGKEYDGIHRTTFLLNEDQHIVGIIEKPKTKEHLMLFLHQLN